MANTLSISQLTARETIATFNQESVFIRTTDMEWSSTYQNGTYNSGKTIFVRKPTRFLQSSIGNNLEIQGIVEEQESLVVYQYNQANALTLEQNTLALTDEDEAVRRVTPTVQMQVRSIESFLMKLAAVYAANITGNAGLAVSSFDQISQTRALLKNYLLPDDKLFMGISFDSEASLVSNVKTLFNPSSYISEQYLQSKVRNMAGVDFYSTASVPFFRVIATADIGTPVTGTVGAGGTTLQITGLAASALIPAETKFTITGIHGVDPQFKGVLPGLQTFSINPDITTTSSAAGPIPTLRDYTATAGSITLSIYPPIITSGAEQTVSASPTPGTAVKFFGASSATVQANGGFKANLMYNPQAFQVASVPLAMPAQKGIGSRITDKKSGLSILANYFYDGRATTNIMSISTLIGLTSARREWAAVIAGE